MKINHSMLKEFKRQAANCISVAKDKATVLSLDNNVTVQYGSYSNVIKTKEFSALEPDVVEQKYYAANVGDIKEKTLKGSKEGIELVEIK